MLTASAEDGLSEARAIFFLFHESLGLSVESKYLQMASTWTYEAISRGALFLLNELTQQESLSALQAFQEGCGYNQHYSDTRPATVDDTLDLLDGVSSDDLITRLTCRMRSIP